MLFLNHCIFSGGAEAIVRCGGKLQHLLITYFLSKTYAKHYENPTMLSRVTAKNVGSVFLRHTVEAVFIEVVYRIPHKEVLCALYVHVKTKWHCLSREVSDSHWH